MRIAALLLLAALTGSAQVKLPEYSREVLPNGAVLLLMPRAGVPLVHFRVLVKGGVESDTPQTAGLAGITAALLRRGTASLSADEFAQRIDFLGGVFQAGSQGNSSYTSVTAEFLGKDFDAGVALLSDAILHPVFAQREVSKQLARSIDGIKSAKDNPQFALSQYAQAAFYGPAHPYGNPATEASLGRLTRSDLVDYHKRFYVGRNMTIVVTGEFDPGAAKAKLAKAFGAAPAGTAYAWKPVAEAARQSRLVLVDKPDATQTYFRIMQPGIARSNPDRVKLELINTLFGGRFTSILNDELRVNTGLTYGAGSVVTEGRVPGEISIATYTKTETTVRAIDLSLDLLKKLNSQGITATQLASVKAYVKGLYPTRSLETMDRLANTLGDLEFYGLNRSEIDNYFARIDAVTLEEANAAAKKYYRPDNLTFVLLGSAGKIREEVKKYDPKPVELSAKEPGWGARVE